MWVRAGGAAASFANSDRDLNIMALAAARESLRSRYDSLDSLDSFARAVPRIARLRAAIKTAIASRLPCFALADHPRDPPPSIDGGITEPLPIDDKDTGTDEAKAAIAASVRGPPAVFWIESTADASAAAGTLTVAFRKPGFTAATARLALERRGVLIGLPANGPPPGNALLAAGVPAALRATALRISFGDHTSASDAKKLVNELIAVVTSRECIDTT